MSKLIAFIIFLFLVPAISAAYAYTSHGYGYSIAIDDSYHLTRNNGVTYFKSKDSDNVVIIKNWPGLTEELARENLQQGYQDERIAIVATGDLKEIEVENGKGLLVDIRGILERKLMRGSAGGFIGNNGQGMIILVSGSSDDWDMLAPVAREIAESVRFVEYSAGPNALDWNRMLAGARLSLRGTSNDKKRREDLDLCSDGDFRHRISASAMKESDTGSAFDYSTKTRSGIWKVVDDDGKSRLLLHYSDGRKESAIIEDRSGQIFLDGQRYYKLRKNSCR